jgi:hypothetical protein
VAQGRGITRIVRRGWCPAWGSSAPAAAAVREGGQHGTYEIQSAGRIRLAFANGSVSVRTIGIGIGIGAGGRPDAAGAGLLLDDVNFSRNDG